MGGKGSGRHKKPLAVVISELQEDIKELHDDIHRLHKKINRVTSRWNYWLKKLERNDPLVQKSTF